MDEILARQRVGVVLEGESSEDLPRQLIELAALSDDQGTVDRCRETAARLFSLTSGVAAYRDVYQRLSLRSTSEQRRS